ncbi:DcaP family trimeric outer membrane transporter [Halomonas sp. 25-S5]|uniref:DcaP family trimeric outer membrane transporter n=1 Tax=Halomonas sp. 25-S5 TaxID=2994065 RepID=UPI0024684FA7|nr:DcaP family trimeric outer membrane transporter [Halomonas sp. 25-S5]
MATAPAYAFDVVEAGQPVVTGEPSRVGPPWNHRSTINIPGTKTDIAFGGYVKLDMLYDFDYDLGKSTSPFRVLNSDNRTDGRTDFTAYESRLNFRTHTMTDYGRLTTYFEGHFLPDGNFGLRHAYGEFNRFLAGQTWTNFDSFVGATRTLALGDPMGYVFERQAQLRYTQPVGAGDLSFSVEDPDTVIARDDAGVASGESQFPDLTVRYEYKRLFSLAGVLRHLSTNDITNSVDDETTGYGVSTEFRLPITPMTSLKGTATYGEGIGNYMGNPGNTGHRNAPDVYVNDNNELEAVETHAFGVSLNHNWTDAWFSSVGFSRLDQDLPVRYGDQFETADYAFANVIWDVTQRLAVGLEYQNVDVEQVSGSSNDASRLQASAIFQF